MIVGILISAAIVISCIFVHYEVLRAISIMIPRVSFPVRVKVLLVVIACFAAHTVEVWLYAVAYMIIQQLGLGALQGKVEGQFADFLYFSATSYSTLGFGDVFPTGAIRIVSGVQGINGLFLIAWSTSFTYFVMDRLWPLHPDRDD